MRSLLTLCERGNRGHPQSVVESLHHDHPHHHPHHHPQAIAVAAPSPRTARPRARRSSKAISDVKVKTDQVDARMLAQLLRVGLIPEAQIRQEHRRLAATSEIVCQVHATLGIAARRGSANG